MKTGGDRARGVSRYWLDNVAARVFEMEDGEYIRYHPACLERGEFTRDPEPQLDEARAHDGKLCNKCYLPIDYANPEAPAA
jgi:hypothetical protein